MLKIKIYIIYIYYIYEIRVTTIDRLPISREIDRRTTRREKNDVAALIIESSFCMKKKIVKRYR